MFKTHNVGTEWEEVHYRDLNVYSQDTNASYTISKNSFANPADNSSVNGLSTETWTIVPASELPQSYIASKIVYQHH